MGAGAGQRLPGAGKGPSSPGAAARVAQRGSQAGAPYSHPLGEVSGAREPGAHQLKRKKAPLVGPPRTERRIQDPKKRVVQGGGGGGRETRVTRKVGRPAGAGAAACHGSGA